MSELAVTGSSSSRALVVPAPQVAKRKKIKETVLDEDTYIDALSTIIQRDFFPDLPKLQAQIEWMRAEQMNDVEKMRELQQRMLSNRRPTTGRATPRGVTTPKGFETPIGGETPSQHPSPSNISSSSSSSSTFAADGTKINVNLPLDKFIERHTSEDDASFEGIMERQHEKHVEKYDWVENKTNEAAVMMIEAAKRDDSGHFPALQTWNYTVRNQLMYVPDGEDDKFLMPPPVGPPKAIVHQNTRILTSKTNSTTAAMRKGGVDPDAVWAMMATDQQLLGLRKAEREGGKVDLADLLGTPKTGESPKVGGYGFMATPSPAPGVDMSPMTTWGRLDGTPLLIDPTETPLDLTPGPSFKLSDNSRREELAMRLADNAKDAQRSRQRAHASPYARGNAGMLSPAGSKLMATKMSSKRSTVGTDMQLRASYTSPAVRSGAARGAKGASLGGITPSPLPSPLPSPSSRIGKAPTPSRSSSSLTDNLLDIPSSSSSSSSSSKKGKSITDDLLKI